MLSPTITHANTIDFELNDAPTVRSPREVRQKRYPQMIAPADVQGTKKCGSSRVLIPGPWWSSRKYSWRIPLGVHSGEPTDPSISISILLELTYISTSVCSLYFEPFRPWRVKIVHPHTPPTFLLSLLAYRLSASRRARSYSRVHWCVLFGLRLCVASLSNICTVLRVRSSCHVLTCDISSTLLLYDQCHGRWS